MSVVNLPRNKRPYFNPNVTLGHLKSLELSSRYIMSIMAANRHLLFKSNKTAIQQRKEFSAFGVKISRETIWRLSNGQYKTISAVFLVYFEIYWNMPLFELYELGRKVLAGEIE